MKKKEKFRRKKREIERVEGKEVGQCFGLVVVVAPAAAAICPVNRRQWLLEQNGTYYHRSGHIMITIISSI